MGFQISWLDASEQTILIEADGGWTWRDYYETMSSMYAMMENSPHEYIDFILDLSRSSVFPTDMMSRMKRHETHQKSRKMVVIGAGTLAQTLFRLMEMMAPQKMRNIKVCKSNEEAYAFLESKTSV